MVKKEGKRGEMVRKDGDGQKNIKISKIFSKIGVFGAKWPKRFW
jgi:hypothetical protein